MLYNYFALAFFAAFGLLLPAAYLLLSKLLRNKAPENPVKNAPFESAEESIGSERVIMHEYEPYFLIFLPFEMSLIVLFFWSFVSRIAPVTVGIAIMTIISVSAALALFGYKLLDGTNGG